VNTPSSPLLSARGVRTYYGNIAALRGVDLDVYEGEVVTLIGANGAGKSTLMMTIFGNPQAREGRVLFEGRDITRMPTHEIARLNIAQAPEGRRIFSRMTVLENLQMGAFSRHDKAGIAHDLEHAFELFPILAQRRHQAGGTLSGGEQQMLAVARALMGRPRLLLLDEPSLGLAPLIVLKIFEVVRRLNAEGISILLVEQAARMALKLAHRGYVMEVGRITMADTAPRLLADRRVQDAYLGQ